MSKWPLVPLKDLLRPVSRPEKVDPTRSYKLLGARWYALGLYVKDTLIGTSIQAPKLYRVHAGDFVYNRLFAWKGSFALADGSVDGCYVSNEFPCFQVDDARLLSGFLWQYFSQDSAWSKALGLSSGGTPTSRNRLKEGAFLSLQIPLPPLAEQHRLAEHIDAIADKLAEARSLREESTQEADALLKSTMRRVFEQIAVFDDVTLESVCTEIVDCLHSNPVYADIGLPTVRSPDVGWGRLNLDNALKTDEAEYRRRTARGEPQANDIIIVREGGGTGKAGMTEPGQTFSLGQRVMMLRPDPTIVEPRFLLYQWLSPLVFEDQIASRMKGSASPHLNIGATRQFRLRLPSLPIQRKIVSHLDSVRERLDALKKHQQNIGLEIDAMLPAIRDLAFTGKL